jgi:hypothetical protein
MSSVRQRNTANQSGAGTSCLPNTAIKGESACETSPQVVALRQFLSGRTGRPADFLACALIAALVILFFYKTVFLGMPISKIARLPEWDSLFSAYWTGKGGNCDPSIVQLEIPCYLHTTRTWLSGVLPLWNPYCGLGAPYIADIQSMVLSPLSLLLMLHANLHGYNLLLVGEVFLAAAGTFALARSLDLPRYAGIAAALTYAFCPFILFYLEPLIGVSHCLFPAVFWLFARAARRGTTGSAIAAGAGCSALILAGHPESSFFGITFASLLMTTLISAKPPGAPAARRLLILRQLSIAGAVAFCLAAPVLIPFAEYLANCDSYKLGIGGSTWIPLQAIAYNLLQPGFGAASPYLGVLTPLMLPLALLVAARGKKLPLCLSGTALCALWLTARLAPFDTLLQVKPFNCLITVYCLPIFLLLVTLITAVGLVEFVENIDLKPNSFFLALAIGLLSVIIIPWLLLGLHIPLKSGDFDMVLPHMAVAPKLWGKQIGLLAATSVAFLLFRRIPGLQQLALPAVLLVSIFASQASIASGSLPIENQFNYPMVDPIPFLQKAQARTVALGNHLFKPNTNLVYGIADIRTHNPLFPSRFVSFLKQCGASVDQYNQTFESADSKFLDLASIKYALSLNPLDHHKLVSCNRWGIHIYQRESALPPAYIVPNAIPATGASNALKLISSAQFDPRASVVLESEASGIAGGSPAPSPGIAGFQPALTSSSLERDSPGSAPTTTLHRPDVNTVVVTTNSPRSGYLVLTDVYYPGWVAKLDGKPVPISRANYMFRAVPIPAGEHQVVFLYQPISFWAGVSLAITCLFLLLAAKLASALRTSIMNEPQAQEALH